MQATLPSIRDILVRDAGYDRRGPLCVAWVDGTGIAAAPTAGGERLAQVICPSGTDEPNLDDYSAEMWALVLQDALDEYISGLPRARRVAIDNARLANLSEIAAADRHTSDRAREVAEASEERRLKFAQQALADAVRGSAR